MYINWTQESLNKLIEIEEFIAEDNPEKAVLFIDYLIEQTDVIAQNPQIGRKVPEFSNPYIRELIIKNYRIVYRVDDKAIFILTISALSRCSASSNEALVRVLGSTKKFRWCQSLIEV